MTKRLLIMRHAKSSWELGYSSDHQRPLNARGKRDAPRMAQYLIQQDSVPEFIFCSTATRAADTAELLIENFQSFDAENCLFCDDLYHASPRSYLDRLISLDDRPLDRAMVVGHNPGLEQLVHLLSGRAEAMPTAAIACFEFDIDRWDEIFEGQRKLVAVWRPKELD